MRVKGNENFLSKSYAIDINVAVDCPNKNTRREQKGRFALLTN